MKRYAFNLLIALDQLVNAMLAGDPDETVSSRAAKDAKRGRRWACILCRILHIVDRNHCEKSVETDEGRRV